MKPAHPVMKYLMYFVVKKKILITITDDLNKFKISKKIFFLNSFEKV